jgi:signal transduction histidine kinase
MRDSHDWRELLVEVERALTRHRHQGDRTVLIRLLEYVLAKVSEMVETVWSAAWLFSEEEGVWEIVASIGLSPEGSAFRAPSKTSLPSRVGEQGRPLLVNDLDREDFRRTSDEHYRMRSALYVPMKVGDRVVGVIAAYSDRRDTYSERDLDLITAVAQHLGVAVAFATMEERATQIAILEERDRHARDLHDGVRQVLSSLRIFALDARRMLTDGDTAQALSALDELATLIDEASGELTESIAQLRRNRPFYYDVYEIGPRMRRRLSASGVEAELIFEQIALEPATRDALAWICREATTNVLKHSNARRASFELRLDGDCVLFSISDDGNGIPEDGEDESLHIGLRVMRERAAEIDATLRVMPARPNGTRVECRVPVPTAR